jgi:hypothetical protein
MDFYYSNPQAEYKNVVASFYKLNRCAKYVVIKFLVSQFYTLKPMFGLDLKYATNDAEYKDAGHFTL